MRRPSTRFSAALLVFVVGAAGIGGCGPRQVTVRTGELPAADASIQLTNSLAQAVNVYVRTNNAGEVFLRQVPGNTTETVPVRGIAAGTTVTLRAAPVDGSVSYSRENVVLGQSVTWRVP